jgi:two-component system sensor histidine kinase KdpD
VARLRKEWLPFEEIAGAAVTRAEPVLEGREVETAVPDEMLLVPVDALLVEQLLVNLLENAAKYSPPGSPIELRAVSAQGAAEIEVADRGPGIPAGDEERIFEKFYRGGDGTRASGTGLGLAVCQAIVRAHGGTITATNRPGGGAILRFTLPFEGTPPVATAFAGRDAWECPRRRHPPLRPCRSFSSSKTKNRCADSYEPASKARASG